MANGLSLEFYKNHRYTDGLQPICKRCQKNKVYKARDEKRANGIPVNARRCGPLSDIVQSEQAIERERQKREQEKQIAESFEPEVKEPEVFERGLRNLYLVREGKVRSSWSTW